jgi:hypothetical protein
VQYYFHVGLVVELVVEEEHLKKADAHRVDKNARRTSSRRMHLFTYSLHSFINCTLYRGLELRQDINHRLYYGLILLTISPFLPITSMISFTLYDFSSADCLNEGAYVCCHNKSLYANNTHSLIAKFVAF